MRAVLQRVRQASVTTSEGQQASIAKGWLVLLGIGQGDSKVDADYLIAKILGLRCFDDADGKFSLSILDIKGELLVVSQFTLYADCRNGRRPSFSDAAPSAAAKILYEDFMHRLRQACDLKVEEGVFQASMLVELANEGPVTLLLDSKKEF